MITRRQFCGVLGGTLLGGTMVETVFANSRSVIDRSYDPLRVKGEFSASKIYLEQWFGELRHQSGPSRREELRKRFTQIRTRSEAALFIPGEGIPVAFREDLVHEAKEAGLRIFSPPENTGFARSVLEEIHAGSSEFTTFAFPLEEACDRIKIIAPSSSQTTQGYLRGYFYMRFFGRSAVSLPLAVILFETSRCLWETYIFQDLLPGLSCEREASRSQTISWDCVHHGYARLIDQTQMVFMNHKQEKRP